MGSDSPRYRTDCYHCHYSVCRNGCDDCSSCQTNMSEHRALRRLESEFIEKVNNLIPVFYVDAFNNLFKKDIFIFNQWIFTFKKKIKCPKIFIKDHSCLICGGWINEWVGDWVPGPLVV